MEIVPKESSNDNQVEELMEPEKEYEASDKDDWQIDMPAVSLLFNLEAARGGRSVLFSDEQKLPFKGSKKGFAKNTKLDFMSC